MTHAGFYGAGQKGLPAPSVFGENARAIFAYEPYLCLLFACYTVLLVAAYFEKRKDGMPCIRNYRMMLLAGWIAIAAEGALVLQHFRPHYLVPALAFASFLNGVIAVRFASSGLAPRAKRLLAAAGMLFACAAFWHTGKFVLAWNAQVGQYRHGLHLLAEKLKTMPDGMQIGYYRSSLPVFALHFGNSLARNQQGRALEELIPGSLHYSALEGRFFSFERLDKTAYVTNLVRSGRCVVIQGESLGDVENLWPRNLIREPVLVNGAEGIYRLAYSADPVAANEPGPVRTLVVTGALVFPQTPGGELETLLTTGKPGAGDFFFVQYDPGDRVRFRYDKWGIGGPTGAEVPIVPGKEYTFAIRYEEGALSIRLGDLTVLEHHTTLWPASKSQVVVGMNALGGSLPLRPFSGQLRVVSEITTHH